MPRVIKRAAAIVLLGALTTIGPRAAAPIRYRFSFPQIAHHWMQVEATFPDLDAAPLELRMSRSSPGRYALHEFAKNVWDVHATDASGAELAVTRPDAYGWTIAVHPSSVTVKYKVFGDKVDGTYLGIDTTHAHVNMPAAIMWARGLDDRPSMLAFVEPAGMTWRVATQLHSGSAADEFTAPNLQYLMDSPVEFGPVAIRTFSAGSRRFRFALHHAGTDAELDAYVKDVEKIVEQEGAIFGEYPQYEPGSYTFLADYLPYASGDGMEHRNSTVMTGNASLRNSGEREAMLGTVSHEFFHCWNVERIRPRSIEPFDFERANTSGELWLAEGFTQYYGELVLHRAGIVDLADALNSINGLVQSVVLSPAREWRSAVDMSRMAPFTDGGRPIDRTNWTNTVISYYPFGGAIALGLDLTLRARSNGRITLDDYMRAMWRVHGKPGGSREGYVDHPYSLDDARARLKEVSGDASFAQEFFARYVEGHEVVDYARLLAPAGLVLRKRSPGLAWFGDLQFDSRGGVARLNAVAPSNSPAYAAGIDEDDTVRTIDGERIASADDVAAVVRRHKPGDRVEVGFTDRRGPQTTTVTLGESPNLEIVPVESTGGVLTEAQRAFRDAWLGARADHPATQR